MVIELVLTLRLVFHLALRQAEGFARSVLRLLGLDLSVPDHTTLSRRGRAFAGRQPRVARHDGPVHVVLDSTGLQVFGQGEWDAEKRGRTSRQSRKLHLAIDAWTGDIVAHVLTDKDVGDSAQSQPCDGGGTDCQRDRRRRLRRCVRLQDGSSPPARSAACHRHPTARVLQ